MSVRVVLATPDLDGPATGGTLFNRQLLAALRAAGCHAERRSLDALGDLAAEQVWVDSLHLPALPGLRTRLPPGVRLGLLLHYLPSLLHTPELSRAQQLSAAERAALAHAQHVITPSAYLGGLLDRIAPDVPHSRVEPGVATPLAARSPRRARCALAVCNVTENKGLLPLLAALGARAGAADDFTLQIAGRLDLEPAYAAACRALCERDGWLRAHVSFLDGLTQPELFERLGASALFVSASRMESYGMALAEARAHGAPILACRGGNVASHVAADSGGQLTDDPAALAAALLQLMRSPEELARRSALAQRWAEAHPPRSWGDAARDFQAACAQLAAAG
jgi:glycosyltransferase involved in cell wall biosynthesis